MFSLVLVERKENASHSGSKKAFIEPDVVRWFFFMCRSHESAFRGWRINQRPRIVNGTNLLHVFTFIPIQIYVMLEISSTALIRQIL